jgi:hypothetical protein
MDFFGTGWTTLMIFALLINIIQLHSKLAALQKTVDSLKETK